MEESTHEMLAATRRRYLSSPDFNGLHLHGDDVGLARQAALELVAEGLVQVVSDKDYMNIHIRPWISARPLQGQLDDLRELTPDHYGVCLYPTVLGMKGVRLPGRMAGRPFAREMAKGKGTLDLVYFRFDVLEQYKNDPRYLFGFGDSGAGMNVSDETYADPDEPGSDMVSLSHIGFAYDLSQYEPGDENSPIVRRVAVFYCDLIKLTPEHQQRWNTYRVPDGTLQPHPLWWKAQMGTWPDGIGPFERLFAELEAINTLTSTATGEQLFRISDRPEGIGWLLRPSQREWDEFISQLDKVLSENLRREFFDQAGIASEDANGQRLGTLSRLAKYMERHGIDKAVVRNAMTPLRTVRQARQRPAHTLRKNIQDKTFVHKQVTLLRDVNQSLIGLRDWFSTHPKNEGWVHTYDRMEDYSF